MNSDFNQIERLDKAMDKRIDSFAKTVKQFIRAADTLVNETQAVAKWGPGTSKRYSAAQKRRYNADARYEDLKLKLNQHPFMG